MAKYEKDDKDAASSVMRERNENPVVYMDIAAGGGTRLLTGKISEPQTLGRLHFELRFDIAPRACANFMALICGDKGVGKDGVPYRYKGTKIHRAVTDTLFQGGDLLDEGGNFSMSIYGGLFKDENFILRHTGPGCLSMCNRGPDTNGSIFQVTFREIPFCDDRNVVFGCLASDQSFETLQLINSLSTDHGTPKETLTIVDCGMAYPLDLT